MEFDNDKVQLWLNYCVPILLATLLRVLVDFRRAFERGDSLTVFVVITNTVISMIMGVIGVYVARFVFEVWVKMPIPDSAIVVSGVAGALLSYSGFNFIVQKLGLIVNRRVDKYAGGDDGAGAGERRRSSSTDHPARRSTDKI